MKRIRITLLAGLGLLTVGFAGCDQTDPTQPGLDTLAPAAPADLIIEGGNGHFSFLPPLSEGSVNGTFNPNLLTAVQVCAWDRAAAGDGDPLTDPCIAVVEAFGSDEIQVDLDDESYHVNWPIKDTNGIQNGVLHAIRVLASGTPIGSAEVVIGKNANQAKGYASALGGAVIPLNANQTLPIKFRVEQGLFCESECYEVTVTQEGGDFTTEDEEVGVSIPAGALPEGVEDVTLIIEEVELEPGDQCLGNLAVLTTTGKCIRFDTEPELANGFAIPVVVGICFDESGVPSGVDPENFAIHHFDPDNPNAPVEELPGAAAPFLDCAGTVASSLDGGPFQRLASAGLQYLQRITGPSPLSAKDLGFGGTTSKFSHFQWALPITLVAAAPVSQSAPVGDPVPVDPRVQVLTAHNHGNAPQVPVPGQAVTFEFFDVGGGSLGTTVVASDANGYASLPWTLTATAGIHTVEVTAFNTGAVEFQAEAIAPPVVQGWTGSGPANFTVLNDGQSGDPSMSYNYVHANYNEQLWMFTTTATAAGLVTLPWTYDFFHSWFNVHGDLWAVVISTSGEVTEHLVDFYGATNQSTGPQSFSGTVQLQVQPGDVYGFRFGGSHYDSAHTLQGTLTVALSVLAPIP